MSLVYLLTHGQYEETEPVAVFTTLVQAQSALPKADWDLWQEGSWHCAELTCDVHQIPFGKLPDGWLAEFNATRERDREFSARMQADREAEAARVAALSPADRVLHEDYLRTHTLSTSSIVLNESKALA